MFVYWAKKVVETFSKTQYKWSLTWNKTQYIYKNRFFESLQIIPLKHVTTPHRIRNGILILHAWFYLSFFALFANCNKSYKPIKGMVGNTNYKKEYWRYTFFSKPKYVIKGHTIVACFKTLQFVYWPCFNERVSTL